MTIFIKRYSTKTSFDCYIVVNFKLIIPSAAEAIVSFKFATSI